jgi:hypothetical protein
MPISTDGFVRAFGYSSPEMVARKSAGVTGTLNRLREVSEALSAIGAPAQKDYNGEYVTDANGKTLQSYTAASARLAAAKDTILASAVSDGVKYDGLAQIEDQALEQVKEAESRAKFYRSAPNPAKLKTALEKTVANGGSAIIDRMVAELGDKVKDQDERDFIIAAMKARFKLDVIDGDMTSKALPKFYKLLTMVPDAHTTDNDSLKKINRVDAVFNWKLFNSWYDPTEKGVVINLPKSTLPFARKAATGEITPFEGFSLATLHEVGHSVDDKLGFMMGKAGNAKYGGWQTESIGSIADKAGELQGLFDDFPGIPRKWVKIYLQTVLETGKADPGKMCEVAAADHTEAVRNQAIIMQARNLSELTQMDRQRQAMSNGGVPQREWDDAYDRGKKTKLRLGDTTVSTDVAFGQKIVAAMFKDKKPLATVLDELARIYEVPIELNASDAAVQIMANHKATLWCKSIRLSGFSGPWGSGPSGAQTAALTDGRVYQQSYGDAWTSYALSARGKGVSDYQFRVPGEWFAELYAFYYLKKLSPAHADYGWFKEEIDDAAAAPLLAA